MVSPVRVSFPPSRNSHVVGKLPNAVSLSCRSLLLSINFEDKDAYERLKEHLCKNYSKSKWQQGYALLDHPSLGDRRPSQLLQDMRALLPDKEAEGVLFQCLDRGLDERYVREAAAAEGDRSVDFSPGFDAGTVRAGESGSVWGGWAGAGTCVRQYANRRSRVY